jgi:DNA-directed RNA polymerase specialized sigma24 family protein
VDGPPRNGKSDNSNRKWIDACGSTTEEVIARAWTRFFQRLVRTAERKLERVPVTGIDGNDLAQSVFRTFLRRLNDGQLKQLQEFEDDEDLWRLLVKIAHRKAVAAWRRQWRLKRAGGRKCSGTLDSVPSKEMTPDLRAALRDEKAHLISILSTERMREIAGRRLDGATSEEISAALETTPRTVERNLRLIRNEWRREMRRLDEVGEG